MIDIGALYDQFNSSNGISQAGFFKPADFVLKAHEASLHFFNRLAGQYPRSQKIADKLVPFQKTANIVVKQKPSFGFADYPKDYTYYVAGGVITEEDRVCGDPDCEVWDGGACKVPESLKDFFPTTSDYSREPLNLVSTNKWAAVARHATRRPTARQPAMRQTADGFEVLPKDLGVIVVDYLRLPVTPVFAYTQREAGPDVFLDYKKEGSTPLEWGEEMLPAFLVYISKSYGLSVRDELILQVASIDKSLLD